MRRLILSIALILLSAACATTSPYISQQSTYNPVTGAGSDEDLQSAGQVCDARIGVVQAGHDTPDAYKQCMLGQGWQYASTDRQYEVYHDPRHPGLACHDFVILGVVGQSCSNF